MEKKGMIAGILAIVALVLLIVSVFAMPWYNVHTETSVGDQTMESDTDYFLDHAEFSSSMSDETEEIDYDNDTIAENNTIVNTFETTQMIGFGGIAGTLLAMVGAFAVAAAKINKKIGAVLVVIGLLIAVIAPVYLMMELPGAFSEEGYSGDDGPHESFFGSTSEDDSERSWGGAAGWYMAVVSAVILVVSLILVLMSSPKAQQVQEEPYQEEMYEESVPEQPPQEDESWEDEEL